MPSRSLIPAVALVLATTACQPVADPQPTFTAEDETAIRGLLENYATTVLAADWTAHVNYYTDDAVSMPPNEPMRQGHAAITAGGDALPPVTAFALTPQAVSGEGDLGYARGTYTIDLAPPGAAPVSMVGKWQAIYQRQADGSWRCISDIWNTDAPAPM